MLSDALDRARNALDSFVARAIDEATEGTAMTAGDSPDPIRLSRGRVLILNRDDGVFGVTWLPDEGQDPPAHTYTSHDAFVPDSFPSAYDYDQLVEFARSHWDPDASGQIGDAAAAD